MARKYKRDAKGRFAGGGGGNSGGGRKSGASKGQKTTKAKVKRAAKAVGKFAKQNPALVTRVALGGAAYAYSKNSLRKLNNVSKQAKTNAYRNNAERNGLPVMKMAKRSRKGAYNISSMG